MVLKAKMENKDDNPLQITKPSVVLDKERVLRNIDGMLKKAAALNVCLRPHFKTHQSGQIGEWFRERGVSGITVSSMEMARAFAGHGWADITVAFPVNILELDDINALAGKIDLGVLVDSEQAVSALRDGLASKVRGWIKIDTGYGRAGIPWSRVDAILGLARSIQQSENISFEGILTHSGQSYQAASSGEIQQIHEEAVTRLLKIKAALEAEGIQHCRISIGDTPTCSLAESFEGVDEIRPGNFVFYDLMQEALGACGEYDIAAAVACPVVGIYEERSQILVYGGAVHLSRECLEEKGGRKIFGYLTELKDGKLGGLLREAPVVSLSQEHGLVELPSLLLDRFRIGDVVYIFPVHACLTCNLHSGYRTLDGEILERL